jgi:hypothetical protein
MPLSGRAVRLALDSMAGSNNVAKPQITYTSQKNRSSILSGKEYRHSRAGSACPKVLPDWVMTICLGNDFPNRQSVCSCLRLPRPMPATNSTLRGLYLGFSRRLPLILFLAVFASFYAITGLSFWGFVLRSAVKWGDELYSILGSWMVRSLTPTAIADPIYTLDAVNPSMHYSVARLR